MLFIDANADTLPRPQRLAAGGLTKGHSNVLFFRAFGSVIVTASLLSSGCCRKSDDSSSGGAHPAVLATPPPKPTVSIIQVPSSHLQFNSPAGWERYETSEWTKFRPLDRDARLAFVTFTQPGEATARIVQIAGQLELGTITWGNPGTETIGPNALPARVANGTFKTNAIGGKVWYATINPGPGSAQLLIVYAVNTASATAAAHERDANTSVNSLRKM